MKNYISLIFLLILASFHLSSQEISGTDILYDLNENYDFSKAQKSNMISHSYSQLIDPATSVSCNNLGVHYANSYYRVFDLFGFFNLNNICIIDSIEIGIASAKSGTTDEQPLFVNFFALSTFADNATNIISDSLVQLGDTISTSVLDSETGNHKMINVLSNTHVKVVKGKYLVVEIGLPYTGEGHSLFFGSNNLGESGNTYIKAPQCGEDDPVSMEELLYDMHMILNVYWKYENAVPEILSFEVEGQIANTVITNEPDYRIDVVMASDTSLTNITPDINIAAGFQINPASGEPQDFSAGSVVYDVNNNFSKVSQTWQVYVTNAGPDIISASLTESNGEIVIDKNNHTVTIPVDIGTDITALNPSFGLYQDFKISPDTEQDFSSGPVTYTVSHSTLSLSQDWDVSVTEVATDVKNNLYREIQISPNPFQGLINLKALNPVKSEVYDFSGRLILTGNGEILNMSNFPDGLYIIKIYTKDYIYTDKLILKK